MKKTKKLLLFLLTMIMIVGATVAVSAAVSVPQYATPTKLSVKWDKWTVNKKTKEGSYMPASTGKKITLYTNMTDKIQNPLGNPVVDDSNGNVTGYKFYVSYQWTTSWKGDATPDRTDIDTTPEALALRDDLSGKVDPKVTVKSSNTAVASVANAIDVEGVEEKTSVKIASKKVTVDGKKVTQYTPTYTRTHTLTGTITVVPKSNGTANITIAYDLYNSKNVLTTKNMTKIAATVKTYADEITVGNAEDKEGVPTIALATNGTYALGAYTNADASSKGLTYKVESGSEGLKVNKNGLVTAATSKKVTEPHGTITITSADKAVSTSVKVTTQPVSVTKIGFGVTEWKDDAHTEWQSSTKQSSLALVTNADMDNHTAKVEAKKLGSYKVGKKNVTIYEPFVQEDPEVLYKSSNPAVAEVNPVTGEVVAKKNGKATITACLKLNNKVTSSVAVTVTTELSTLQANNVNTIVGKTGKIGAGVNAGVANVTYKYNINSIFVPELDENTGEICYNRDVLREENEKGTLSSAKKIAAFTKKYLTVDSKGTVKGVRPCMAQITVTASRKNGPSITKDVYAYVSAATNKVTTTITQVAGEGAGSDVAINSKNKAAVAITSEEEQVYEVKAELSPVTSYSKDEAATLNTDYVVTSSKPAVIEILQSNEGDYFIAPRAKGSSVITVTAADGSGKKQAITVTVTVDAYEISSAKAQYGILTDGFTDDITKKEYDYDEIKDLPVIVLKANSKNTYKASTEIAAKTNASASNTGVAYYYTNGTSASSIKNFKEGSFTIVVARSKDGKFEQKYVVYRPDQNMLATKEDVNFQIYFTGWNNEEGEIRIPTSNDDLDEETFSNPIWLTAGETIQLYSEVLLKDPDSGKLLTDVTAVTYATSNKKIATVSSAGLVKAVGRGYVTITATYRTSDGNKVATAEIYVGRSKASVEATIDAAINSQISGTDFNAITGAKPSYNSKTKTMTVAINDPSVNITELQGIGALGILNAIRFADYSLDINGCYVTILSGEDILSEINVAVMQNEAGTVWYDVQAGDTNYKANNYEELKSVVKKVIGSTGLDKTTWLDWAGLKMYVDAYYSGLETVTTPNGEEDVWFGYGDGTHYTVDFTITDAVLTSEINKEINAAMDDVDAYLEKYADQIPGIVDVDYNAETSTFTANVTVDEDLTFGELFDAMETGREDLVKIVMNTLDGFSGNVFVANAKVDATATINSTVNGETVGTQTALILFDGEYVSIETSYDISNLPDQVGNAIDRLEGLQIRDERGKVTEDRVNNAINRILNNTRIQNRKISELQDASGIATVTYTVGGRTITKNYTLRLNVILTEKEEMVIDAENYTVLTGDADISETETEETEAVETETEEAETEETETEETETEETEEVETEAEETEEVETETEEAEAEETETEETETVENEAAEVAGEATKVVVEE